MQDEVLCAGTRARYCFHIACIVRDETNRALIRELIKQSEDEEKGGVRITWGELSSPGMVFLLLRLEAAGITLRLPAESPGNPESSDLYVIADDGIVDPLSYVAR